MSLAACGRDATESTDPVATPTVPDDDPSTSEPTTTTSVVDPGTTTSTTASSAGSSTTSTTAAPAAPAAFPYWSTECTERRGDPAASYESAEALGNFTTLGAIPTLDIGIPGVITSAGPYGSLASTAPIPGGVLVGVYPPNGWPVDGEVLTSSSLAAVDHDGTIRWRRCFDRLQTNEFAVAPAELEPTTAWVIGSARDQSLEIVGVDLVTGDDVPFPGDVASLERRGDNARFVVLGRRHTDAPFVLGDVLTIVDALDGTSWEIPVPPSWVGGEGGWIQVIDPDPLAGAHVFVDGFPGPREAASVFVGEVWTDDSAVQREFLPPRITETFGEPFELQLYDGAGDLVWAVPDFHSVGREGFHWAIADRVVLAVRCTTWDEEGYCGWVDDEPAEEELVALDRLTGEELWVLPGARGVPVIAGDTAIISDPTPDASFAGGYVHIDLRTGQRTDAGSEFLDAWPAGSFAEECCGGYDTVNVKRSGGVVVATNLDRIRVWYPPELTTATVTVDLAG